MRVLFAAPPQGWDRWSGPLRAACPEMELLQDGAPDSFDALIYAPGYPAGARRWISRPSPAQGSFKACGPGSSGSWATRR